MNATGYALRARRMLAVRRGPCLAGILAVVGGPACTETPDEVPRPPPGALIRVTADSNVAVVLDEIPEASRERVVQHLLNRDEAFWVARAKRQLALASYRLNFRAFFYDEAEKKQQLPLPPEDVLRITIEPRGSGELARRESVEGHDTVGVRYTLEAFVVTDRESPGISEPALASVGGLWEEPFTFPVDPELLIQRTGFACMDEGSFPPGSVDTEDVEFFYDQECEVEEELTPDACHYTQLPTESCQDALGAHVGRVDVALRFERVAWDDKIAATYRVGAIPVVDSPDLSVLRAELDVNRLTYRYIPADSCAIEEACVGGQGWRRLLQFNASEENLGSKPLHIGEIDYFVDDPSNPTGATAHNLYEFSACHNHYHYKHYAQFTYGDDQNLGSKRAFCVQSVNRYGNHEASPTWSPYGSCEYQGISEGWGDQYNAGIECQWLDVTSVDTRSGPITRPLGFSANPDGFLCEGAMTLGSDGLPVWEATPFVTDSGQTVEKPACSFAEGWSNNNYGETSVTLGMPGEGMITAPCTRGQLGRLRNCGFTYDRALRSCEPGATTSLRCGVADGSAPQVLRVCEASRVLQSGVACAQADALINVDIVAGTEQTVSFACPLARDAQETGGSYAMYTGPSFPADESAAVTCVPVP